MSNTFEAHNIDSWVLASSITGKTVVDNKNLFKMTPIQMYRRQLHYLQPAGGGIRKPFGGTISINLKKGSVVNSTRYGMVYVGGTMNAKISLHDLKTGHRLTQTGIVKNCTFLHFNSWRTSWIAVS